MAISVKSQHKIFAIIMATVTTEPTSWDMIVNAVKAEMTIKNWLDVRGVLQHYGINQKLIARTNNTRQEQYIKL